jgi:hypothetical protein
VSWLRELAELALHEQREHHKRVEAKLDHIITLNNELKGIAMTDQDTINQIASDLAAVKDEVNTVVTELGNVSTAGTNIEAELTKLIAAQGSGTPLDFSALQSAVSDLKTSSDTAKSSADNLVTLLPDPGAQSSNGNGNGASTTQGT